MFTTTPDQICVNVCVINDMIVEDTEQFGLTLTPPLMGTNLVFSETAATVFLIDSSGKINKLIAVVCYWGRVINVQVNPCI